MCVCIRNTCLCALVLSLHIRSYASVSVSGIIYESHLKTTCSPSHFTSMSYTDFLCYFSLLWQFAFPNVHVCQQSNSIMPNTMRIVPFLHKTCRNSIYPQSNVRRFPVPDHLTAWIEKYDEYSPEFYESPVLIGKPWADPSIGELYNWYEIHSFRPKNVLKRIYNTIDDGNFHPKWNKIDGKIDRTTFHGEYEIRHRYPLNVAGRTGITGRGLLGRWGVNHAADPIVTR